MKIAFNADLSKDRERSLFGSFIAGVKKWGDTVFVTNQILDDIDLVCVIGVKHMEMLNFYRERNVPVLYFDKAYLRNFGWRMALNEHQPTVWLKSWKKPDDRAHQYGMVFRGWRNNGGCILFAGSSAKYHRAKNLEDPTVYAKKCFEQIRKFSNRDIIYRPKPSWKDAVPIDGAFYSRGKYIADALGQSYVLVTHGSNSCCNALLNGIPTIILGDGVTKEISSTDIQFIEEPYMPDGESCQQLLNNLAYCQYTLEEIQSGVAWKNLRSEIIPIQKH